MAYSADSTEGLDNTQDYDAGSSLDMMFKDICDPYEESSSQSFFNNGQGMCKEPLVGDSDFPGLDLGTQWPLGIRDSFVGTSTGTALDGNSDSVLHPGSDTLRSGMYKPGASLQFHKPFLSRPQGDLSAIPEEVTQLAQPALSAGDYHLHGTFENAYENLLPAQVVKAEQPTSSKYIVPQPFPYQDTNILDAHAQTNNAERSLSSYAFTQSISLQDNNGYCDSTDMTVRDTSFGSKKRKTDDGDLRETPSRMSSSTMSTDGFSVFSVSQSRSSMASIPTARSSLVSASSVRSNPRLPDREEFLEEKSYVCPACNLGDNPDDLPQRTYRLKLCQRKLKSTFVGKTSTRYKNHLKGAHRKLFETDIDPEKFVCRFCPCAQAGCEARFDDWDALFEHVEEDHSSPMSERKVHCHACPPLRERSFLHRVFRR